MLYCSWVTVLLWRCHVTLVFSHASCAPTLALVHLVGQLLLPVLCGGFGSNSLPAATSSLGVVDMLHWLGLQVNAFLQCPCGFFCCNQCWQCLACVSVAHGIGAMGTHLSWDAAPSGEAGSLGSFGALCPVAGVGCPLISAGLVRAGPLLWAQVGVAQHFW